MAKNQKDLAEGLLADENVGWLTGFLADEDEFDRRTLWRLGSWGIGSIGAVIIAILAYHSGAGFRHEHIAAAVLARQSQQLQSIAKAGENETRRLASAIDTLNGDRDRLFARVTVLEQGLDSVTGSISRKNVAQNEPQGASSQKEAALSLAPPLPSQPDKALSSQADTAPSLASAMATSPAGATGRTSVSALPAIQPDVHPSPAVAPVASAAAAESVVAKASAAKPSLAQSSPTPPTPVTPQVAPKPATVAENPSATRPGEPNETAAVTPAKAEPENDKEAQQSKDGQIIIASIPAIADAEPAPSPPADIPVAHTDFGVDLGSASSIKNLRVLWRSAVKSDARELASLYPIIVMKERSNGPGMQLRLVAGPLADAAAAAKICAVLSENGRDCKTAVFDGQRLAMKENADGRGAAGAAKKPRPSHASSRHRHSRRAARVEEPAPPPPSPPPQPSTLRSLFSH